MQPPLQFGILTDIQYADQDASPPNHFRASPEKLRAAIAHFNSRELDFIINLGDTIDRDLASFDTILPLFESARAPVHHLLGNHDFAVAPGEKSFPPKLLNIPGPPYYRSLTLPGYRLILLDGNHLSLAAHPPGSTAFESSAAHLQALTESGAKNAQYYNGAVGSTQLAWLDGQLSQADQSRERAIVFNHFPVLPESTHTLWDADGLIFTLTNHPSTILYCGGHQHSGDYTQRKGIHFLTLNALLESESTPTFATVQMSEYSITITGHGNQSSHHLPIT